MFRIRRVRTITTFFGFACLVIASVSNAQLECYYGKISHIYMFNGGFILTMEGAVLNDCKYSYASWIDTSTDAGIVMFSAFLARAAASQSLWIGVSDKTVSGAVTNIGDW